jgi:hypothetical protein
MMMLHLTHSFESWRSVVATEEEKKHKLLRLLRHYANQLQTRAMSQWHATVSWQKRVARHQGKAALRWRYRAVSRMFDGWVIRTKEKNMERKKLRRACQLLSEGTTGRVFRSWHVLAMLRAQRLESLRRVCNLIGQKYRRKTFESFVTWRTNSLLSTYEEMMAEREIMLEEKAYQTIVLDRQSELWQMNFFHRLQNKRIRTETFCRWVQFIKLRKKLQWKLKIALLRMRTWRMGMTFEKWSSLVMDAKEMRDHWSIALRRLLVLLVRTRKGYLMLAWRRMRGEGGAWMTELGAPPEVIQQIEWTFARNLDRGIVAKEHVQDVAIEMIRRQYHRVLVAKMFGRWAAIVLSVWRKGGDGMHSSLTNAKQKYEELGTDFLGRNDAKYEETEEEEFNG